ncbi:hypothetical protein EMPG_09953 [Blastomyces silverae]|uniref:DUF7703 domain-containing protein n=1 Tax=Blastomyces silverae TaxID=2060906 RepID=A0A0H1B9W4_9EURO|nr:hypothetical protein EMPG_09953 [Blastomyces silverae]
MSASDPQSPGREAGLYHENRAAVDLAVAAFVAVAGYNSFELFIIIFMYFKRYRGLYFTSLLISTLGVMFYALGLLLFYFQLTAAIWFSFTLIVIPWIPMVTGQSMVLYSRLHLLVHSPKILRSVLCMIIINAFLLHIPTGVLAYGTVFSTDKYLVFRRAYSIMEKLELTMFCVQEFALSGIYIWQAVKLLRVSPSSDGRVTMYQLLTINSIIIVMDIALLVIEYLNFWIIQVTLKGTIYSMKLKFEFAVLSKLVSITRSQEEMSVPTFVNPQRLTWDVSESAHASRVRRHSWLLRRPTSLQLEDISDLSRESALNA